MRYIIGFLFFSTLASASPDTQIPLLQMEMEDPLLKDECRNGGFETFSENFQNDFRSEQDVRNWCNQFMNFYRINRDRFNDHCGWQRFYRDSNNFHFNGVFIRSTRFLGQPRFHHRNWCG